MTLREDDEAAILGFVEIGQQLRTKDLEILGTRNRHRLLDLRRPPQRWQQNGERGCPKASLLGLFFVWLAVMSSVEESHLTIVIIR